MEVTLRDKHSIVDTAFVEKVVDVYFVSGFPLLRERRRCFFLGSRVRGKDGRFCVFCLGIPAAAGKTTRSVIPVKTGIQDGVIPAKVSLMTKTC
jgi:hypothetical protein